MTMQCTRDPRLDGVREQLYVHIETTSQTPLRIYEGDYVESTLGEIR
jgi:hypothetical protein